MERIGMGVGMKFVAVAVVIGILTAGIGIYAFYNLGNRDDGPAGLQAVESYVGDIDGGAQDYLKEHDFVVVSGDSKKMDTFTAAYKQMNEKHVPVFVTSDSVLHTYHVFFDDTLRKIEEQYLYDAALSATRAMLERSMEQYEATNGSIKDAAKTNVAYYALALKLLEEAHQGERPSNILSGYREDFSQYIPRGHYTRSETLKRYFKAMMYYGRINLGIGVESHTQSAIMMADGLRTAEHKGIPAMFQWYRIYNITERFVGESEDLTPMVYQAEIDRVYGDLSDDYAELNNDTKMETFKTRINTYPPPKIAFFKGLGFRFMGQRFVPDSYMFQEVVYNKTLAYTGDMKGDDKPFTYYEDRNVPDGIRHMPRGLDIMSILGSEKAATILENDGDTDYVNYDENVAALTAEFMDKSAEEWTQNMYWGWLYALESMTGDFQEEQNPDFMKDEDWQKVKLNTNLASWAELRHDTILYAKQSETMKGGSIPGQQKEKIPDEKGYVEPVVELYTRLIDLTNATKQDLEANIMLDDDRAGELDRFVVLLERLRSISNKELDGRGPSQGDYAYLRSIGIYFEKLTGTAHSDGLQTTIIADVHTDSNSGKVLEEGVGYVDFLVVKVKNDDGETAYMTGPIFTYYEFKHPMNDRLTDEKWTDMLEDGKAKGKQAWFRECYGE